jgi:hypothetical protein
VVLVVDDDTNEHAVIVHLVLSGVEFGSDADQAWVRELEDQLITAIGDGQVGEYLGNEFGEGEAVLSMYGPDAESLFGFAEPTVRAARPQPGSRAIKRCGSAATRTQARRRSPSRNPGVGGRPGGRPPHREAYTPMNRPE